MDNNVKIILGSGDVLDAVGISYMNVNAYNKDYIFYSLNELANGNMDKIYIAQASTDGLAPTALTEDEWNTIKAIMLNISHNEPVQGITYKPITPGLQVQVGDAKKLAVKGDKKQAFIDAQNRAVAPTAAADEPAFVSDQSAAGAPFFSPELSATGAQPVETPTEPTGPSAFNMAPPVEANIPVESLEMDGSPIDLNAAPTQQIQPVLVGTPGGATHQEGDTLVLMSSPSIEETQAIESISTAVPAPVAEAPVAVVDETNIVPAPVAPAAESIETINTALPVEATPVLEPAPVLEAAPVVETPVAPVLEASPVVETPVVESPVVETIVASPVAPEEPAVAVPTVIEATPVEITPVDVAPVTMNSSVSIEQLQQAVQDAQNAINIINQYLSTQGLQNSPVINQVEAVQSIEPAPVMPEIKTAEQPEIQTDSLGMESELTNPDQAVAGVSIPVDTNIEPVASPVLEVAPTAVVEPTVVQTVTPSPVVETLNTAAPVETVLLDTTVPSDNGMLNTAVAAATDDSVIPNPIQPLQPGTEELGEPAFSLDPAQAMTPQTISLDTSVAPSLTPNSANDINNSTVEVAIPAMPVIDTNAAPTVPIAPTQISTGIPEAAPIPTVAPVEAAPAPVMPESPAASPIAPVATDVNVVSPVEVVQDATAPTVAAVPEISEVQQVPTLDLSAINTDVTLPTDMASNPNPGTIAEGVLGPATLDPTQAGQ